MDKKQLLDALKKDLDAADNLRQDIVQKVDQWKKEYNGEAYGNEQTGKSALVSRDIKRQDEWQHASVKDPFVSNPDIVRCNPVTFEDRAAAEQNELVLNYQFTRQFNRYKFMTDVIKLYYSEGTVIVKTSWEYEDQIVDQVFPVYAVDPMSQQPVQVATKEVKARQVMVNRPHAEICRIEDIYLDPTAMGDTNKAQFIIHRFETDLSTLRREGKYKNLKALAKTIQVSRSDEGDYEREYEDFEFEFQDKARKKFVMYEYWGNFDINGDGIAEPIVAAWANDIMLRASENPMPDKKLPFLIVANNSIPFNLYGEAAAELIGDNQKVSTAIKRGIIDNMAASNNGQKGIRHGALDPLNKKRFLNNKHFEFNGTREDFFEGSYNQIPQSVFSVLELVNNETESITGVKGFAGGISGQTLGSTATSARGALDAVSVRRLDIVRNIAENLVKPLMRKWMAYNAEFLREEEVIRITNDQFVPIKRDDLKGQIDIQIEVSTAEDNSSKAQELSFLLQTLGQQLDPGMMKLLMGQIAKLNKMPDLAKQIEEYQPQPDPLAEEFKMWELEKLKSEVKERLSRTEENATDVRAKTAKAELDEARARNLDSDTDNKDLDFTRKATGQEFDEEMSKKGEEFAERMAEKQYDRQTLAGVERIKQSGRQQSASR